MDKQVQANKIVNDHVVWSLGAGLMPIPLFDIAAVTAVQMDMLKQLSDLFEVDYSKSNGKAFVSALTGSTFARLGASAIKLVPGVGTVVGGLSMSVLSGASTYAIGQVAINHFGSKTGLCGIDMEWAKQAYEEAIEHGKRVASDLKGHDAEARDPYEELEKLGRLKESGVITDEEFETQKRKLLERL